MFTTDWLLQSGLRATLLLTGLFFLWRILPAAQPALRRWVLLAACAGLLAAPWVSGWWEWAAPGLNRTADASFVFSGNQHAPAVPESSGGFPWAVALTVGWLTGSFLIVTKLLLETWALRRLIQGARPWQGSSTTPQGLTVLQSSAITGPCVAGGLRPVLLLPDSAHTWTPAQWRMVLAHETQHLSQRDLLLAWLPRLVLCLYWWHPLAHWLRRQFHAESEALCDGAVVARSGQDTREYVEFLVALNTGRLPALSAGMAMKSRLGQRIERLLLTPPRPVRRRAAAVAILFLATIGITAITLRTLPPDLPATASATNPPATITASTSSHNLPQAPDAIPARASNSPPPQSDHEVAIRLTANPFPGD